VNIEQRLINIKRAYEIAGLQLSPCVTEDHLCTYEQQWMVRLPEEYRSFVKEVGNGGDGPPHYGLFAVEKSHHDESGTVIDGHDPAKDFPLENDWIWESDEDYDESAVQRIATLGHIFLGTDGCGMQHVLVIAGPETGNVWLIADEGAQPVYFRELRRHTFLDWIEAWLEGQELFDETAS
jgi:SMI1 / KNR4 family (SUKH-1)